MTTLASLAQRVYTKLSLLGGLNVQTYAQPRIYESIQGVFNEVLDDRFWSRHMSSKSYVLDGSTGTTASTVSDDIKQFNDIKHIWMSNWVHPLPRARGDINPSAVTQVSFRPYAANGKIFSVLPFTTKGTVNVSYRIRPNDFTDNDDVPFDPEYLVNEVAARYFIIEGANTAAAKDCRDTASRRMQQLIDMEGQHGKSLHSPTLSTVDQWRDA